MKQLRQLFVLVVAFLLAFTSFDVAPASAFTRVSNTDLMPKNRLVLHKNPNITNFNVTVTAGNPNRGSFNSRTKYGSFQQEYGYRSVQITKPSQNVDFYSSDMIVAEWGNVGTYDGQPINMRATFRDMKYASMFPIPSASGVNAGMVRNTAYIQISESPFSGFSYYNLSHLNVTYQFFNRSTGLLINVPGAFLTANSLNGFGTYQDGTPRTITGVDWDTGQSRTVADPGLGEFVQYDRESTVHVRTDTNIARRSHSGIPYTSPVYIGTSNHFVDTLGDETFTKNSASFLLTGSSHTFTFGSGKRNSAWAALSSGVLFRPEAEPLQKQVVSTSGANINGQDIPAGTTFRYRVTQRVHILGEDIVDKYASFTMRDDLPSGVTYQSARILDQYGNAVSSPGTISHSGGVVTYTASANMRLNVIQYEGERYTLEITVRANDVGGRTSIANTATRSINNDSGTSNTVTNVITPNSVPVPPPPVTTDPEEPPIYNITALHVHRNSGTVIRTEYAQVREGDTYSFSSYNNLTNGNGYRYIPLAPTTRSGVATGNHTVYLYYDLPLVDLGLRFTRIYTDERASGLPVTVEFDPTWIDASNPSQLSGYSANITFRNRGTGAAHTVTHPLTSMTYTGRLPASVLSALPANVNTASAQDFRDEFDVSFTVSNTTYIVARPETIRLHGYKASTKHIDATGTALSYTGAVMVQNTVGGSQQVFNETLSASTFRLPLLKTGYGFGLETSYTYTNNLTASTEISGLNGIPASNQPVNAVVDPRLIDSHVNFKNALNPTQDHPKGTVSLIGSGSRSGRLYSESYTLPHLKMESVTGNLFTMEQATAPDPRIRHALKDAGQRLFVPIWAELGTYDYRFESVGSRIGANKVRFTLRNDMTVHAHMFNHVDSGTPDDDELLLTPLSPEEAERSTDDWYKNY